jgi:geranylgeranyl diphosphate synthase type II
MNQLTQLQTYYQAYAKQHPFNKEPKGLYEPVDYILSIGGKQLRPLMLLMTCKLFSDDLEKALPAAYAIEIFHNFSLVHDDIMDAAPLRRGKPTVHHKWNTNTGILSGDVMLVYAYEYLRKVDNSILSDVLGIFNKVAIGVCEGQQYDVDFETMDTVTIPEYIKMIELKTSVLVAGAMQIGALIGGASEHDAYHLGEFGRNIGIAFQLQDDILDTYGDPEKFGKKVGGDIAQNKKTFLVLKSLELADEKTAAILNTLLSTQPENEAQKIKAVTAIFDRLDIRTHANAKKEAYRDLAYQHLKSVQIAETAKQPLYDFAQFLVQRDV